MDTGQSKHRLLIVDGDPKSLRVLEVSLKKAGFGVATACDGSQALTAMAAGAPDLIISDTDLQGADGFELCRRIKAEPAWSQIPFLFVSGRKSIEDKIRGLELGVDDYLTKPVYIKEIGVRVRTALQRAERERLESRRDTRTRFSGDLTDIGVVDLVQTIDLNRKSGIVHIVDREGRRGAVFFRDGRVIDAEVGRLAGAEAMYRLFSWSEGRFEVEFKPIRRRDVMELPTAAVLMEGMRRLDEWTRLLETLPGLDQVVAVDYRVLAEQLAELPDEVNGLLRLCDGSRTLQAVIDDSDYPDLEALTVASNLFEQHVLYARESHGHGESEPSGELARWLEEGQALVRTSAEEGLARASVKTTLHGMGTEQASLADDTEAGRDVLTFAGEFISPSLDVPVPRRKPDDAAPVSTIKNIDTLRGLPVPQEPETPLPGRGDDREADAFDESSASGVVEAQSRVTTLEYAPRELDPPVQDDQQPALAEEPNDAVVATSLAPCSENSEELRTMPGRHRLSETFVVGGRLLPPRHFRIGPIVFFTCLLGAAGVLVRQLRSEESAATTETVASASELTPTDDADNRPAVATLPPVLPDAALAMPTRAEAKSTQVPGARGQASERAEAPKPKPPATLGAFNPLERCRKYAGAKPAAVLAACQAANQADPNATDVMVILARVELDRGRTPEARTWAKKAIEVKPDFADAYVFLGGAEQEAGNASEAKAAYKKYLELAPRGRYARELRAVLNSL